MKICILLIGLALLMPLISAQAVVPEVNAGIAADSIFYGIDVWWDNNRVNNAKTLEEQIRLRLEIAEERAAEMQKLALQNKLQYMARTQEEQLIQITECENLVESADESVKLEVQQRLQKHIMVLETIQEQVPEAAQAGIETALENSNKAFERIQERIQARNRQDVDEIREMIEEGKIKIMAQLMTQQATNNQQGNKR